MTLEPLTLGRFVGVWRFDPWAFGLIVSMLAAYLLGVDRVRRTGQSWPIVRTVAFVLLGLGVLAIATMSSIAVYSAVLLWPMALRITLLLTIVPVGIGLGDPIGLVSAGLTPAGAARWQSLLHARPVRALTFPVIAPLLAVATQFLVFFTGYLGSALDDGAVMRLLELQLLVTGCLFALPLLGVEVLPVWCTQPVRMTIAAVDGLLDAIPGIAVMTTTALVSHGYYAHVSRSWGPSRSWDQIIAGGLMLTVAEVVAIPFIAILFRAWIREDAWRAEIVDEALDAAEARQRATAPADTEPDTTRPWWEVDPGPLADRADRYGWRRKG
ncbi:MAG TPA: cytochrome c oxidase assembly protein [Mycobacteriales bacterium]|jgi:putative copper resistance protein D|nr:cytochrome c oxidase assembly protein [Mycobacteriales bacterium]